ncbi:MAG: glycosyltransferase family 25 protein [Deltaproteobacteria bacterium]|nr:glycosyltransferase family 25 protein [Deltaproteobacteria bacterium]MBW2202738.1 glycosyltransferase family 25 protein [Deltaproteobacteria bacterium]
MPEAKDKKMPENFTTYWEYFDKIYCISLYERVDRREQARAQFRSVGLADRVEFMIVNKHPVDCEQGIYESHILCMEKAIRAHADTIVIFEDDIIFDRFNPDTLKKCIGFLRTNTDSKMMFFGCMVKKSRKTDNSSVLKIRFRSLAHAYALTAEFAKTIVKIPWQKIPFDDMLRGITGTEMYAVYPSFAFQSNSRSDNQRCLTLDKFRRLCGGLRRIQKMNEFFNYNKTLIIGAHILLVLLIIAIITL